MNMNNNKKKDYYDKDYFIKNYLSLNSCNIHKKLLL
jgi:hypothetical protein